MSYLGLDVGTTGSKACVFDVDGKLLGTAYREYPLLAPEPGAAEIDSARVCQACVEVIREASAGLGNDPVRGLGISSQGEAFTPVSADGRILANGMVSSDTRSEALVGAWSREFGRQRLYEITGHTSHPMFTLFKLLWLRDNRPAVWRDAARFYCFEELIQWRLGLDPAISWPLAGRTMLFDVRTHAWSEEILAEVGLDARRLSPPVPSGTVVGTIPASRAAELGLPAGVKVVAGGHDQPCGALGAGAIEPGLAMYASGTVECICPAFDRPILGESFFRNNLCTYDYTVRGMYTTVAFSLTGGNLLQWFRDQWGQAEIEESERVGGCAYDLLLNSMPSEPTDLVVLPYFTPSGTPYFDAQTPAAIVGLRIGTTRYQVLRALLEGIAMEMRLNVEILQESGLGVREFRAIGGGAKNPALAQLKADVLGRPITTLAVTEAGCLGVAMLACEADTETGLGELVQSWVTPRSLIEPDPKRAEFYRERFGAYKELYPTVREYWSRF